MSKLIFTLYIVVPEYVWGSLWNGVPTPDHYRGNYNNYSIYIIPHCFCYKALKYSLILCSHLFYNSTTFLSNSRSISLLKLSICPYNLVIFCSVRACHPINCPSSSSRPPFTIGRTFSCNSLTFFNANSCLLLYYSFLAVRMELTRLSSSAWM